MKRQTGLLLLAVLLSACSTTGRSDEQNQAAKATKPSQAQTQQAVRSEHAHPGEQVNSWNEDNNATTVKNNGNRNVAEHSADKDIDRGGVLEGQPTANTEGAARTDRSNDGSPNRNQSVLIHPRVDQSGLRSDTPPSKSGVLLNVPLIRQNPELKFGCEVTSLAMLMQYTGKDVTKMQLAEQLPKDPDPVIRQGGNITRWGNPSHGFVGDMTGKTGPGFAVFNQPMEQLMRRYLGDRTLNLTGQPFHSLLTQLEQGRPVVIWTTGDYRLPDRWEAWKHGQEQIKTPLDLHAVVLTGYDPEHVYLNDPLSGKKNVKVDKQRLEASYNALGKQALSYR
ncbi:C39 family peptidase [Brevibacillus dissolubilis]|uniref:C39 family peptidase n=1 Tax=Brevibacillus dissolubilis TaxID=1844116 RepID=UPI001117420B|nr:C39 family peptidase [Brevibacillus dissolubilis]